MAGDTKGDGKMRRYVFALVVISMTLNLVFVPSASAQSTPALAPAAPMAAFPVQETSGDFTLRLTGARWTHFADLHLWQGIPVLEKKRIFFVSGRVTAIKSPATAVRLGDTTEAVVFGAQGQRLAGYPTRPEAREQGWIFDDFDSFWQPVRVEFTLKEPAAPADADGTHQEQADLVGVPVFADVNATHPYDQTLTTALGTKLVFRSLRYETLPPSLGDLRNLVLEFTVVPPPTAPDLTVNIEPQVVRPAILDNLGDNLSGKNSNFLCSPHYEPPLYQFWLTLTTPPPAAKTLDLHMTIFQSAPSLKKTTFFHKFAPVLLSVQKRAQHE